MRQSARLPTFLFFYLIDARQYNMILFTILDMKYFIFIKSIGKKKVVKYKTIQYYLLLTIDIDS